MFRIYPILPIGAIALSFRESQPPLYEDCKVTQRLPPLPLEGLFRRR